MLKSFLAETLKFLFFGIGGMAQLHKKSFQSWVLDQSKRVNSYWLTPSDLRKFRSKSGAFSAEIFLGYFYIFYYYFWSSLQPLEIRQRSTSYIWMANSYSNTLKCHLRIKWDFDWHLFMKKPDCPAITLSKYHLSFPQLHHLPEIFSTFIL